MALEGVTVMQYAVNIADMTKEPVMSNLLLGPHDHRTVDVVRGLADVFEADNERFDRDKFFDAVYHHGASRPDSGR